MSGPFDAEVLQLLAEVLASVTLNVGSADFEQKAPVVIRAKQQLAAALAPAE